MLRDNGVAIVTSTALSATAYSLNAPTLANGSHPITATATDIAGNVSAPSEVLTAVIDTVGPTVTVNQAVGQPDPATTSPISFTGVFSELVAGLTASDVSLSGTANASTVTIVGTGPTYTFNVTGMTRAGTVVATMAANAVTDLAGNNNVASTSTDNSVTYAP